MGAVADAGVAYRDAVERAPDDVALCRARLGLAAAMRVSDQHKSALTELEAAEPIANARGLIRELSLDPPSAGQRLLSARQHRRLSERA